MEFGSSVVGFLIFLFGKGARGVYIVFTDGFLLFFSGQGGVNHFRPLKIFFECFVGLDFGFVQCEIWSLGLGLLDLGVFCLEKGPGGLHCFP